MIVLRKNKKKPIVLFMCSPSLGALDSWLSVLRVLKNISPNVYFIFLSGKENFMNQVFLESEIIKKSDGIFDLIVFRSDSGLLLGAETFGKAIKLHKNSRIKIFHYSRRIVRKLKLNLLYKILYVIYENFIKIMYRNSLFNIKSLEELRYTSLLDISELIKDYTNDLYPTIVRSENYSLLHGTGIHGVEDYSTNEIKKSCQSINTKNTIAYLFSKKEIPFYENYFHLTPRQMRVYGVPKHEAQWINNFDRKKNLDKNKYIFIISRPVNEHIIKTRRLEFLKMIKKIAIKYQFSVVIKLHPTENDSNLYNQIFESGEQKINWKLSNNHPLSLDKNCELAISYYSGVPLDLLHLGIPTIELSNFVGINRDDHKDSLRNSRGEAVREYRYLNLVLGASSYDELEKHVIEILKNKEEVLEKLKSNYSKYFPLTRDVNNIIASEIRNNLIKIN